MKARTAAILAGLILGHHRTFAAITLTPQGYQVHPGDSIQEAVQLAADNPTNKVVQVHAGEYRPSSKRQAMIWLNRLHDGVRLEAKGAVTLSAANPQLALPSQTGFPAAVNHVVYFGDGISTNTVLKGFRITGANGFLTKLKTREIEPDQSIPKNLFFYSDGGAIKVFGRSYPTLLDLELEDNFTSPCGAGLSIQHEGHKLGAVIIGNCRFINNRAQGTGSALDLLPGSAARLDNCLFARNASNMGEDPVAKASGERPFVNNGAVTIFWKSHAEFRNCTFTGNRNGVDDMGGASTYLNCVFADNALEAGLKGHPRYELAVNAGAMVKGCVFTGGIIDVQQKVSATENILSAPPPRFDADFVPAAPVYANAGYRPTAKAKPAAGRQP
jgi:hypothetical protein